MKEYVATVEEVKEFCNKVREAGGARPLGALMPGVPTNSHTCLIAKNLNFECYVTPFEPAEDHWSDYDSYLNGIDGNQPWVMAVGDIKIRDKIAQKLNLQAVMHEDPFSSDDLMPAVILPERIANAAMAFDTVINNKAIWRDLFEDKFAEYVSEDGI